MDAATPASTIRSHKHSESVRLPAYSVHMDAIRALAAFTVLAGHARMLFFGSHKGQSPMAAASNTAEGVKNLGLGHHAVIVFFVLSGFLVGNSAWRAIRSGRWSWKKYLLQRMTRLWIVLLPALIIGGVLDHAGMHFTWQHHSIYTAPAGQAMVGADLPGDAAPKVLLGNAVFLQTIRVPNYGTNSALWSLANEFWYYMAFPPLLLLFFGNSSAVRKVLYVVLVAGILTFVGVKIAALFLVWLLGFVISVLPLKFGRAHQRVITVLCFLQFAGMNALIRMHPMKMLVADGLLGISFALFLYAVVHARQPSRSMLYQHVATFFSKFSYTVYLVHLPFLTLMTALIISPWHAWPKNPPHLLAAVLLVILAYAYAFALYSVFEGNTEWLRARIARLIDFGIRKDSLRSRKTLPEAG